MYTHLYSQKHRYTKEDAESSQPPCSCLRAGARGLNTDRYPIIQSAPVTITAKFLEGKTKLQLLYPCLKKA